MNYDFSRTLSFFSQIKLFTYSALLDQIAVEKNIGTKIYKIITVKENLYLVLNPQKGVSGPHSFKMIGSYIAPAENS